MKFSSLIYSQNNILAHGTISVIVEISFGSIKLCATKVNARKYKLHISHNLAEEEASVTHKVQ